MTHFIVFLLLTLLFSFYLERHLVLRSENEEASWHLAKPWDNPSWVWEEFPEEDITLTPDPTPSLIPHLMPDVTIIPDVTIPND